MKQSALSMDQDLRTKVSDALFTHPETRDAVIEVINENGVITLIGEVVNEQVRQAAGEVASSQPGVISIVNSLKIAH